VADSLKKKAKSAETLENNTVNLSSDVPDAKECARMSKQRE